MVSEGSSGWDLIEIELVGCVEPCEIDLTKTIENTGNTSGKDKRSCAKKDEDVRVGVDL
jgi:hypothetical protein